MTGSTSAADFLPDRLNLASLRRAAEHCRGCELYRHATQTVFGEGSRRAAIMLIGETPGDEEDVEGRPFVGPAGRLLDLALEDAGLSRDEVYVTNAVKHFRWEPRGKRRLHKKPTSRQIKACEPWLDAELEVVHPAAIVCLGATAAQALLGRDFRVSRSRGEVVATRWSPITLATHHPSAVLRSRTSEERAQKRAELTADLQRAVEQLSAPAGKSQPRRRRQ
jgi:DNA polymerase